MNKLWTRSITGLALALGVLASGTSANAAFFTPVNVGAMNEAGGAGFWDGNSTDFNTPGNIGNFLLGNGAFTGHPNSPNIAPGNLAFLNAPGFFLNSNTDPGTSILLEVAGFSGTNQLWVWEAGALAPVLVMDGNDTSGTINISSTASLILVETTNNRAFFSDGFYRTYNDANNADEGSPNADPLWYQNLNAGSSANQNFAAFVNNGIAIPDSIVYVGIEDLVNFDGDYNDMVIKLTFTGGDNLIPTPAPPAAILALIGIVPCLALRRRLRGQTAAA